MSIRNLHDCISTHYQPMDQDLQDVINTERGNPESGNLLLGSDLTFTERADTVEDELTLLEIRVLINDKVTDTLELVSLADLSILEEEGVNESGLDSERVGVKILLPFLDGHGVVRHKELLVETDFSFDRLLTRLGLSDPVELGLGLVLALVINLSEELNNITVLISDIVVDGALSVT